MKKLSVIVTAYNEADTLGGLIAAVRAAPALGLEKEIIIVDDCSTDGTRDIAAEIGKKFSCKVLYHARNRGKGAALKTGFLAATGDIVITQDADIEYDPAEYEKLIWPILSGKAAVVYGSRFTDTSLLKSISRSHRLGNHFLTAVSNFFTGLRLTDMETGYKVFRADVIKAIAPRLRSERFEIEPELTARVAKHNVVVIEVPITYKARDAAAGKKIRWRDGLPALGAIIKYKLFS